MANETQAQLNEAINAARRGEMANARRMLQQVIISDPNNEKAWLWLATTSTSPDDKQKCLRRVLEINPNNARAAEALSRLESEKARRPEALREAIDVGEAEIVARPVSPLLIIGGILGGIAILVVVIVNLFGSNTANLTPFQVAQAITQTAAAIPTITSTPTPRPTNTPNYEFVPLDQVATLPPTFTPTPEPTATATFTPTNTPPPLTSYRLIYTGFVPGDTIPTLYTINADGSDDSALSISGDLMAISPDGRFIAYVRPLADDEVAVEDALLPTETPTVTATPSPTATAAFEDASTDIPIATQEPSATPVPPGAEVVTEVIVAPFSNLGNGQIISQTGTNPITGLTWTPDGQRVLFIEGGVLVKTVNRDGSDEQVISLLSAAGNKSDPAYAPDGEVLLFASDVNTPNSVEIYALTFASGEIEQLTDDTGSSFDPAWSPDGSQIAFISDRSGDADVYVMDGSGSAQRLLTSGDEGAEDRSPAWSPDGRWLAFSSNRDGGVFQIYLINATGTVEPVTDTERNSQSPIFRR